MGECLAVKERKRRLGVASGGNHTSTTHSSAPSVGLRNALKIGFKEQEKSFQMGKHGSFHVEI